MHSDTRAIAIIVDKQGVQRLPAIESGRAESGPMQFGQDWPGIFLRGDNACYMAMTLQQHIEAATPLSKMILAGFAKSLQGCHVLQLKDEQDTGDVATYEDHRRIDCMSLVMQGRIGQLDDTVRLKAALLEGAKHRAEGDALDTAVELCVAVLRWAQDLKRQRDSARKAAYHAERKV